jgi:hypothetical protein
MPSDPKAQAQADLIFAILTLDSYNRGYGSGIQNLSDVGQIGSWSILTTSEAEYGQAVFNSGFYAIAYSKGTDTVIAFRGTDDNVGGSNTGGSDALGGYGIALGATPDSGITVTRGGVKLKRNTAYQ